MNPRPPARDKPGQQPRLDPDELELWMAVVRVSQLLPDRLDDDLREIGANLPRYEVLAALDRYPDGVRPTDLCQLALVSKPRMSVHVNELVAEGYVRRGPDPADGRASLVAITPSGRKLLAQWRPRHVRLARELVIDRIVDHDDREATLRSLRSILESLGDPWACGGSGSDSR